jgi:hypothetical protein
VSLTLFVGSNDPNLAEAAQSADSSAYLIDQTNQHENNSGVCYTSISDIESLDDDVESLADFASLLRQADVIIYVPDPTWNADQKVKQYSERYWVERYLYTFSLDKTKKILNCPTPCSPTNDDLILTLNAQRKNNDPHLWVSGCSSTWGVGVEIHETYGSILAEKLNLPLCMLARPGASVAYAADQILRSDVRKGDLVILGITDHQRKTYYDEENSKIVQVTVANFKKQNRKIDLTDPTLLYDSVTAVHQVLNFCRAVNAKLILIGIHTDIEFAAYLKNIPSYIHANGFYGVTENNRYKDIGFDGKKHPGPASHREFADKILNKLKEFE